ncbi:hypothetical protein GGI35DRAFT_482152 [Trichoderma velutinum]
MLGVAAKDKDEPVDAQMVWAGLGPARQAGVCVQFPHVVLQEDQRLVEAESSSPVCQLSITLVLGERGQSQSQSHGPEPEPNRKPRARPSHERRCMDRGAQGWCYCLGAAVARVEWMAKRARARVLRLPHSLDSILVVRSTQGPVSGRKSKESSRKLASYSSPHPFRFRLESFGQFFVRGGDEE